MTSSKTDNLLIFSKTSDYRHDSIPTGITALKQLTNESGNFRVTASEDASLFTSENLSTYRVICLLQNSGDFLTGEQLSALQGFVRSGGGVFGIHCAAAGMLSSDWYRRLIGAHFDMHPDPEFGSFKIANESHPINCSAESDIPLEKWKDEWYNFNSHPAENDNLDFLLTGNPATFKGGKHGSNHPLAWCQEFEGGRSAYIALGHFDEAWEDKWFSRWVERGLLWTARREAEIDKAFRRN